MDLNEEIKKLDAAIEATGTGTEYIDLVLVRHEHGNGYLFYAPLCSGIAEGDEVIVDTKYGNRWGIVEAVATVRDGGDVTQLIAKAAGATLPLKKVLKKVFYRELWENVD